MLAGFIKSPFAPRGNHDTLIEVLEVTTAGGTKVIYANGNTNAGAGDLKHIQRIAAVQITQNSGTQAACKAAVSDDEAVSDKITITGQTAESFFVTVFGYPQKGGAPT